MPWQGWESTRAGGSYLLYSTCCIHPFSLTVTTTVAHTTPAPTIQRGITKRERGRAGLWSTDTEGDPGGILGCGECEKPWSFSKSWKD